MTTPSPAQLPPRFLRPHQVEALYGLSRNTSPTLGQRGDDPPFSKPSARLVLYSVDELEKWLAQRRRVSTCDPGPME